MYRKNSIHGPGAIQVPEGAIATIVNFTGDGVTLEIQESGKKYFIGISTEKFQKEYEKV